MAEHEARETSIENLRRELAEEMRREVRSPDSAAAFFVTVSVRGGSPP